MSDQKTKTGALKDATHGHEAAQTYDFAYARTQEQIDAIMRAGSQAFKQYDDAAKFGKDNLDALMASGTIVAKGFEDLGKIWMGMAQRSVESSIATSKALFGCKTLQDMIALQTDWTRSNLETLVNEGNRVSEVSVKTANEAAAPIAARVNAAVEQFLKTRAA
jgi:phasin family protein